jgi:hypothetical protein
VIRFKGFGVPVFSAVMAFGVTPDVPLRALQTSSSIVGAWTLNKDLSDTPRNRTEDDRDGNARGERRRGGGGGGGGFRGGRGGGRGGRGGDGQGRAASDPEQTARQREALRDLTDAPAHLTIVRTESMVVVTTAEGRTTRLSPDNHKIKDGSTGVERKSRWEGGKLVSEISGLPRASFTETYAIDPERGQLVVTLQSEGRQAMTMKRVYDRD